MKIATAYIEITNRCNLNCADCYNASGNSRTTAELAPETLGRVFFRLASEQGMDLFHLSGGEPTLHSRWGEVLDVMERFAAPNGQPVHFYIITNGVRREERLYRLLETNGRFIAQFSLDGVDAETHDRTRGRGSFEKTVANLTGIKPIYPPVLKMVISKYNRDQAADFVRFADSLGCRASFSFVRKMGNADPNWENLALTAREQAVIIREIEKAGKESGTEPDLPYPTFRCPLADPESPLQILIRPDGSIHPCQALYDDAYSVGSVYDLDWDVTEKMAILSERLKARQTADYGCPRCISRDMCGGGCPAMAYMLNGDELSDDGGCDFRRVQTARLAADIVRGKI